MPLSLICDLNAFVLAYIFNSKIMLEGDRYSFGKIYLPQVALDELQEWQGSQQKKAKFGSDMIRSMVEKCSQVAVDRIILSDKEKNRFFYRCSLVERKLANEEKSTDTSDADKMYLAMAHGIGGNLVTQEKTLRSLGEKIIGKDRVFSFADMVIDRICKGLIEKNKVEEGMKNLEYYGETFIQGNEERVVEKLNKRFG